mgnify:CR=1 FL=1
MPHGIRKETYDEWLQRYYEYRYGSVIPVNDDVRRTPMFITADQIEPAYGSGVLLLIALGAVALLLLLIMRFKIHAFVALVLVSLLTALATKISYADVVPTLLDAVGIAAPDHRIEGRSQKGNTEKWESRKSTKRCPR